jgi:maleylpyruvate isomerase
MSLTLHGYWRSSAAYRVRIAANLKGLNYAQKTYDLRKAEEKAAPYLALDPQGLVPTLEADGVLVNQSPAILEWLEERYPAVPLLPPDATGRATVRAMAAMICCDIHPINNLRILQTLRRDFGASEAQVSAWIARWIADGFVALEALIAQHGRGFAYGDAPTFADCCLVPQVFSAERFAVDLTPYPHLMAAAEAARALQAVAAAHPSQQPDAD